MGPWLSRQKRAPKLIHADRVTNILVSEYLEGRLVEGAEAEYTTETYVQAGALLRAFRDQNVRSDPRYEPVATAKALAWLGEPHRIEESAAEMARAILGTYDPKPVDVVPTHGDWQPRNWLVDGSEIRVFDFGRFGFRPAASDFCRLAVQQWRADPLLESALFSGYGSDPRDSELWKVMQWEKPFPRPLGHTGLAITSSKGRATGCSTMPCIDSEAVAFAGLLNNLSF